MYKGLPMTERQFHGLDIFEGDLKLSEGSIPEKFSAKIQGSLRIGSEVTFSDNFAPIVHGTLSMAITDIPRGFNPKVSGSIHMDLVEIIPDWWKPIFGGVLFTKEGIDMSTTCINAVSIVPTLIGYRSHHHNLWKLIPDESSMDSQVIKTFYNGKYMEVDGSFAEIISQKGNTYKLKEIASDLPIYCVTDGQDNWSHGDTLRMAHIDLKFKTTERDLSQYRGMTKDTVISYDDAIIVYRDITGACSFGVNSFVSGLPECKINETYTIGEILELTVDQYGHKVMVEFIENGGRL